MGTEPRITGRCLLLAGGPIGDYAALRPLVRPGDFVLAADSGYRHAAPLGLTVDLLLGDFDSLGTPPAGVPIHTLPVEKDETDTLAAVRLAMRWGCRDFLILGAFGGRFDHSIANLITLREIVERGGRGMLADDRTRVHLLRGPETIRLPRMEGWSLSLFSMTDRCTGVCESGVHNPLDGYTLEAASSLGVSNAIDAAEARISLESGILAVIQAFDGNPS